MLMYAVQDCFLRPSCSSSAAFWLGCRFHGCRADSHRLPRRDRSARMRHRAR